MVIGLSSAWGAKGRQSWGRRTLLSLAWVKTSMSKWFHFWSALAKLPTFVFEKVSPSNFGEFFWPFLSYLYISAVIDIKDPYSTLVSRSSATSKLDVTGSF